MRRRSPTASAASSAGGGRPPSRPAVHEAGSASMIGRTLGFYFARQFATLVISIFLFFFFLVFLITYLEFFTRNLGTRDFDPVAVFLFALYRVPSICEDILPFTTLSGSIAAFILANRRLEIVIARAAGISAWQFLIPACIVGLLLGGVATAIYN